MPRKPRASRLAAFVVALALAACNPTAPTAAPTAPPTVGPTASPRPAAEIYAEIREAVADIRGLEPTSSVDPVTIDEAQLRENLEAELDAEQTPAELAAAEDVLITLGLLPPGSSLRELTLDFQAGQVAGYYSPDRDQLFVVSRSGALGPAERVTYAHEFTHQLQDQHIDLDTLGIDVSDQTDQSLARLALVEGDASTVQSLWTEANLTSRELGELLASSLDPEALSALRRAPAFLRETALFPYQDGLAFVTRLVASGGFAAVDAAFDDPPDSTEQVLHPDRYLDREAPIEVSIPSGIPGRLGAGWQDAGRDTLGELVLRVWLREGGIPAGEARAAAAGWGGDRLILLRGPDRAVAVGLLTTWDSAADAAEFADAASAARATLTGPTSMRYEEGSRTVALAFGPPADELVQALGN
jgi:hypothetical protein